VLSFDQVASLELQLDPGLAGSFEVVALLAFVGGTFEKLRLDTGRSGLVVAKEAQVNGCERYAD
jgi:hypothetical protein